MDGAGRIYLADPLQDRVAVFFQGRPVGQTRIALGARADLALADGDSLLVLDRDGDHAVVRRLESDGRVGHPLSIGDGIPGQIRTVGGQGLVDLLPQDMWTPVFGEDGKALTAGRSSVARPVPGGGRLGEDHAGV